MKLQYDLMLDELLKKKNNCFNYPTAKKVKKENR